MKTLEIKNKDEDLIGRIKLFQNYIRENTNFCNESGIVSFTTKEKTLIKLKLYK